MPRPIRGLRIATQLCNGATQLSRPSLLQGVRRFRFLFRSEILWASPLPIRNQILTAQLSPVRMLVSGAEHIPSPAKIPPEEIHDYTHYRNNDVLEHMNERFNEIESTALKILRRQLLLHPEIFRREMGAKLGALFPLNAIGGMPVGPRGLAGPSFPLSSAVVVPLVQALVSLTTNAPCCSQRCNALFTGILQIRRICNRLARVAGDCA
jgi:hypothetical protein